MTLSRSLFSFLPGRIRPGFLILLFRKVPMLTPLLYLTLFGFLAHATYTAHITHRALTNFVTALDRRGSR